MIITLAEEIASNSTPLKSLSRVVNPLKLRGEIHQHVTKSFEKSGESLEQASNLRRLERKGNLTLARGAAMILQSPTINLLSLADAMTKLSSRIVGGALYKAD